MSESDLPQTKAELMTRIYQERQALEGLITGLSDEQLLMAGSEGWSVKDHLAHIAAWEQILLLAHLQGRSFAEAAEMDEATAKATEHMTAETGLNDYFYRRDQNLPLPEVLRRFHESHRQLVAYLDSLSFDELIQPRNENGDPLLLWVPGDTYEHYREHNEYIQAFMG